MDKINYIKHYLYHQFSAKSLDGIHSPFVFDLASKIIKSDEQYYAFNQIEYQRKKLLLSKKEIEVEDFGAGSKIFKSNKRKVADIAKTSLKPPKQAQLLFKLVNYFKFKNILELGTCLGLSSAYLAKSSKKIDVTTIEGASEISKIASKTFDNLNLKNIRLITGQFDTVIPNLLESNPKYDCIFIDGNHQKQATLKYFQQLLPHIHNDSLMVFDDIYWSKGMTEAWSEIKAHKNATVTIDLFYFGLVFFRKEQPKEHFKIKMK